MTGASFVFRGLRFFRSSYLGVFGGSALGAMVLLGALMAGDSVKETLLRIAEARLGKVDAVLVGGDRMFRSGLADDLGELDAAPVLFVKASVSVQGSGRTLGGVQVLGVDKRFWKLAPGGKKTEPPGARDFFVNQHLARSLDLGEDATLVLRFEKPALIANDAPLAGKSAELIAMSGSVREICGDKRFGRFSLEATQLPQATVYMPIERLQEAVGFAGKANLMLLRAKKHRSHDEMLEMIRRRSALADYGLSVAEVPLAKAVEVRTSRIFFDREVASVIRKKFPSAQPVITYMANTIAANGRETPYSMVTAVDSGAAPFLTGEPGGVVINQWESEDLGAKTGDEVRIDYYALDAGNRLVERSAKFPVAGVVPLTGLAADQHWMPDFPGVADAENATDWDAGVPIDMKRIRDKDEAYWDAHRGTPKLFLPLEKGRELFGNRWGEFTALRIPMGAKEDVEKQLSSVMTPQVAGLMLQDVGIQAMAAAASPVDFAGLFIGMSLFLMVAAVALTAMLFRFHIEQRNRESGLLAALGIPAKKILRWRLMEGFCVVAAGSVIGSALAAGYTRLLLRLLETIWSGSGGKRVFHFHVETSTLIGGAAGFVVLMMWVIWWVTRNQSRRSASLRLEAGIEEVKRRPAKQVPWWAVGFALAGICAMAGAGVLGVPGAFFLAGFLFLLTGLTAYRWVLQRGASAGFGSLTSQRLADLNCARRATRSQVVVGSLACGVFLVISVAAFRKHSGEEWRERASGAGGFAFWVETTSPADDAKELGNAIPIRIGSGDDASCFNLNNVARPRLLAVDVEALSRLGAFPIKKTIDGCAKDWKALKEGDAMRAFVDETTLLWVLKKKPGDRILYQDEWGREYPVEIAGTLDGTVFQGSFVVDETRFLKHHPSAAGPRVFLVDGDPVADRAGLEKSLADHGAVVTTTRERLDSFHRVENTYISIFNLLGGLGVIVGSAGLGLVIAGNLRERRAEFAILRAVGVPESVADRVVMLEVRQFIRWGLGIGLPAAMVSILPSLASAGTLKSIGWIVLLALLIAANAWFWSWIGYRRQIRVALNTIRDFG